MGNSHVMSFFTENHIRPKVMSNLSAVGLDYRVLIALGRDTTFFFFYDFFFIWECFLRVKRSKVRQESKKKVVCRVNLEIGGEKEHIFFLFIEEKTERMRSQH